MRIIPSSLWVFLAVATGVNVANAQPAPGNAAMQNNGRPPEPTPQETITKDLNRFVGSLTSDSDSFFSVATYISGVKMGYYGGQELLKEWSKQQGNAHLQITKVDVTDLKENDAKARVAYIWWSPLFQSAPTDETFVLHRTKVPMGPERLIWQVVPNVPTDPEARLAPNAPILNLLAQSLITPQNALEELRGSQSLTQLKHLSLGALQFIQDYDQVYALLPQYAQEAFKPYLGRESNYWQIPAYPQERYTFNPNLSGVALPAVKQPSRTILFYEGQEEQPLFRYNGKAAVAFTDGHCKLVAPDEMKSLSWTP